jgi:hypothetical protein
MHVKLHSVDCVGNIAVLFGTWPLVREFIQWECTDLVLTNLCLGTIDYITFV